MGRSFTGLAGEHLVIYDLLRQGIPAFLSGSGLRYDVVADIDGQLVRIQVKSTDVARSDHSKPSSKTSYIYNLSDGQDKRYKAGEFDLVAFVALTPQLVAYLPAQSVLHRKKFKFQEEALYNLPFKEAYDRHRYLPNTRLHTRKRLRNPVARRTP